MHQDKINKSRKVHELLDKMADLNITSSSGDTLFDKVTKVLKSILAIKVEDGNALSDHADVLALRLIRKREGHVAFEPVTWYSSRNPDAVGAPMRDQYRPTASTRHAHLDYIMKLYSGIADPRYAAVARTAEAMRSAPPRALAGPYSRVTIPTGA